ncbi:cysteine hydrolase [Lactiplantibacillus paraplantarum]|uniref:cysteine hydrolase family protein n=1 Tax=Lactiplantibacillus paraplantarum TaxID=60520 RepID=UPI00051474D9|nr:cysteine hydrolase family protein [Lactiplantibacillus paraplantarum]OAX74534.1 amidase [Lactiplantibacillus plantarum]ALO04096.1 amidase [Lactiplantibacillus paraplantarum]KGE74488.1 amidase [Lactiplantibacillus paraplantarum]MCT4457699.1 cysteine hydrolase [Lactiplantibacillus paraplantarum]MCW1910197.1 cysteine hydrolase [Lactiplantibacillus paraplantarum]
MADVLIIIDMQIGVCRGPQPVANLTTVMAGIQQRIAKYRSQNKPIVFVQHHDADLVTGSTDWQIMPALPIEATDIVVHKTHANAFYQTDLQAQLTMLGCQSLEICGAQVEFCVDTTIKMAHGLGYQLEMVRGLTTTTANPMMSAQQTIDFYQDRIWNHRFLTLVTA